jgi:uncharacterized membrane protein
VSDVNPADREEVAVRSTPVGWLLILVQLAFGFVTVAFAVDEGFARGKVVYARVEWRYVLGLIGLFLFYRAARAVVRTVNHATVELSAEQQRRSKRLGRVSEVIGIAFLLASYTPWVKEHSVAFASWAKPLYTTVGCFLIVMGAVSGIDGRKLRRLQQARAAARGEPVSPYLSSDE